MLSECTGSILSWLTQIIQPGPGGPISSFAVVHDYLYRRFVLLSQNLTQQK
jgi:hypothetical protein